jgi:hypothetical protein
MTFGFHLFSQKFAVAIYWKQDMAADAGQIP